MQRRHMLFLWGGAGRPKKPPPICSQAKPPTASTRADGVSRFPGQSSFRGVSRHERLACHRQASCRGTTSGSQAANAVAVLTPASGQLLEPVAVRRSDHDLVRHILDVVLGYGTVYPVQIEATLETRRSVRVEGALDVAVLQEPSTAIS